MGTYEFVSSLAPYKSILDIKRIISMYYFEFSKNYSFSGERHDFWEFVFVDKGQVEVLAEDQTYSLKEGEIIFHQPNEFHRVWSNGVIAPNVLIISFVCSSPLMDYFAHQILRTTHRERETLSRIIQEARHVFKPELGMLWDDRLRLKEPLVGAEQLMYSRLTEFLFELIRDGRNSNTTKQIDPFLLEEFRDPVVMQVITYMKQHIDTRLTLESIASAVYLSKSKLKSVFKAETGIPVISYLNLLRITLAKQYIREHNQNFTQIAMNLGFESVHYFSTSFKQATGFTPSQYSRSIEAAANK